MSELDYRLFTAVTIMRDVTTLHCISSAAVSRYRYVINGTECTGER
jgi:hypothetical protein